MHVFAEHYLAASLAQYRFCRQRFVFTHILEIDLVARAQQSDTVSKLDAGVDLLLIDLDDNVADLKAGVLRRGFRLYASYQSAALDIAAQRLGRIGVDVCDYDTQQAATNFAEIQNLTHDRVRDLGGYREADANVTAGTTDNRGVDTDELAVHVDECAARVARINGCIRLNKVFIAILTDAAPAQRTDNS